MAEEFCRHVNKGERAIRILAPSPYTIKEERAEKYGNGIVHLTTRQGFEIKGIHFEDMDAINEMLQPIIGMLDINQKDPGTGYPASGTRNICACIGNNVCPFANYNTAKLCGMQRNALAVVSASRNV